MIKYLAPSAQKTCRITWMLCNLKYASLELIRNLYRQMYKYADSQGWCDKDYSQYVKTNGMTMMNMVCHFQMQT